MGINFEISGIDSTSRRLRGVAHRARNLEPLWPKVERYLRNEFEKQIESQGDRGGTPWEPLDRRYAAEKAAEGLRDTLVRTGGLKASWLGRGRYPISEHRPQSLTVGTRHPLAHIHERGTDGGHVPARPVLAITADMSKRVRDMVADYLLREELRGS